MPKPKAKPTRIRDFVKIPVRSRSNPQQIRRLFFDTIDEDFEKSCDAAAIDLLAGVPIAERRAYHRRSLAHTLYRITRDDIAINYSHLELLARHYGIPTGLLLIFTRLQAELANRRGGGLERARATVRSIDAGLQVIRDALDNDDARSRGALLGRQVLRQAAQAYQPEQPQLDLQAARPRARSSMNP